MVSKTCDYAVQLLLFLGRDEQSYFKVQDIAGQLGLPYAYLAKVAQMLAQARLVRTSRGRTGGLILARPLSNISLADVRMAVEGDPMDDSRDSSLRWAAKKAEWRQIQSELKLNQIA